MIFKQTVDSSINSDLVIKLSKEFKLDEKIIKILISRGLDTSSKIENFLNPSLKDFNNPFLLNGMKETVERIEKAIENKERVLIYGDYDVDGVSATAILFLHFKSMGLDVNYFLPNRYVDGYGLTKDSVKKVYDKYKPDLIITVDCGISCYKEVEYIKELGMDVIITDHHEIPEILPDCTIVNAKMEGQMYPFRELCGAGVAYKILQALVGQKKASKYLPIAAIATIADIVSLTEENRAIVVFGMKAIKKDTPLFIELLLKDMKLDLKTLSATDIAFKIAPKINAAGRMGDASKALELYIREDKKELVKTIQNLNELNVKRQELCNKIYDESLEEVSKIDLQKEKVIVLAKKGWDSGLLGIVSARLVEQYNRPTFLLSITENGECKGSARSIGGVDIHKLLSECKSTLEAFGGHTMAAGLTVMEDNLGSFKSQLTAYMNKNYTSEIFKQVKSYALELDTEEITINFIKNLNKLEPFGCCNKKPIFRVDFQKSIQNRMKKHPNHLTINAGKFSMLAFNYGCEKLNIDRAKNKIVLVDLQLNLFRGKQSVKGIVKTLYYKDLQIKKLGEFVAGNYLRQLSYNDKINNNKVTLKEISKDELKNLLKQADFGNLIVCNSLKWYSENRNLIENNHLKENICCNAVKTGENSIVLGINNFNNFKNYKNIIFTDNLLDEGYLNYLKEIAPKCNFYILKDAKLPDNVLKISQKREIFIAIFNAIKNFAKKQIIAFDSLDYYQKLIKLNPQINKYKYSQFMACVLVFTDLKILEENVSLDNYTLTVNEGVNSKLQKSKFYNLLSLLKKV